MPLVFKEFVTFHNLKNRATSFLKIGEALKNIGCHCDIKLYEKF